MITSNELIKRITSYIKNKKTGNVIGESNISGNNKKYIRIFLGLSDYPDGSNLKSKVGLYSKINSVSFFSSKEKPDLFFVLSILMGDRKEAYNLISTINNKNCVSSISWDNVIKYLAIVEEIYFVNYNDNSFGSFNAAICNKNADYLLFSTSRLYYSNVKNLSSCHDVATVIHPSAKNLNSHSRFWFEEYVLQDYLGKIGNSALNYNYFQLK